MRVHPVPASILIMLLAGCEAPMPANNSSDLAPPPAVANDVAATPAPAAPTGEAGMRQLAECSATFEAISRLFRAVANTSTVTEAESALALATERAGSASLAELRAREIATQLGRPAEEVDRLKRERHAAMERERAGQDFGDFAIWLGRESDRCVALDPLFR